MIDISTLNPAQQEAVTAPDGPVLVIAGAGSGKTRTLVHRLAWLVEHGARPESILLLTFTRKAANEMLLRARHLAGSDLEGLSGGTFHGFAYGVLRRYRPAWATGPVTVMDQSDMTEAIGQCKASLSIAKGDRSFPKAQHILGLLSKVRNKETSLSELLLHDAPHLCEYADDLSSLAHAYQAYKKEHNLLDYDDLLFELEDLLHGEANRPYLPFSHILVDEYQDTNKVQARLVRLLAGDSSSGSASVMAVGDDAQSIYAFRGADVRNILNFPNLFPGTRIIRLEENYRSTRPILEVANAILANATEGYSKNLFTRHEGGDAVRVIRPQSDMTQAKLVARRINELLEHFMPEEIAVLFRSGFHSYHLEVELTRLQIPFRKYGGLKYTEAKHIKNVLGFIRLLINPLDLPAFFQVASLCPGIGPKTAQKIHLAMSTGNQDEVKKQASRFAELGDYLMFLDSLRAGNGRPADIVAAVVDKYRPALEREFPEDYPRRLQGLEELMRIADSYQSLDTFVADLSLNSQDEDDHDGHSIVLSTIHSAKGLEWDAVILIDLVEDRFPSKHASGDPEEFEEERRLMYVACTRARKSLDLCVPRTIYDRQAQGSMPVAQSPFVSGVPSSCYEEWMETYGGGLTRRESPAFAPTDSRLAAWAKPTQVLARPRIKQLDGISTTLHTGSPSEPSAARPGQPLAYCRHKIFGRGKIVELLPPDKVRVNFPGLGLKVIIRDYLTMEE